MEMTKEVKYQMLLWLFEHSNKLWNEILQQNIQIWSYKQTQKINTNPDDEHKFTFCLSVSQIVKIKSI